jgi:hypothetical protein
VSNSALDVTKKCLGAAPLLDNTQDWIYELDNPYLQIGVVQFVNPILGIVQQRRCAKTFFGHIQGAITHRFSPQAIA